MQSTSYTGVWASSFLVLILSAKFYPLGSYFSLSHLPTTTWDLNYCPGVLKTGSTWFFIKCLHLFMISKFLSSSTTFLLLSVMTEQPYLSTRWHLNVIFSLQEQIIKKKFEQFWGWEELLDYEDFNVFKSSGENKVSELEKKIAKFFTLIWFQGYGTTLYPTNASYHICIIFLIRRQDLSFSRKLLSKSSWGG